MSISIIEDFADQLYQDQIQNSKQQNSAVLFQINQQAQKIAWQINLINQFFGKEILNQVGKNKKYIPAIHNIDRTYTNQENKAVLALFKKNPIYTSVWHQVNKAHLEDLDQKQLEQVYHSTHLDYIWKTIKYDNSKEGSRWLQIGAIYLGFSYDGMMYVTSNNTTYAAYQIPPGCPYIGPYRLDIRCRYYYQPTIDNISTVIFSPQLNFGFGTYYFASNFCQRTMRYATSDPNSSSGPYCVLCITLSLSVIPAYFNNFSSNSKYQMLLDPLQLTVVYSSLSSVQQSQSITVQQIETQYLQDQTQSQIFLENVSPYKNYILQSSDQIDILTPYQNTQKTFEYNRNGTDCFAILNIVTLVDKVPKFETLKSINPAKKFQLKSVYLFLDVLSKQNMQIYAKNLEEIILYYNQLFTYISWGLIIIILIVQIYYSIQLGSFLLQPVIHLTYILKQIKFMNQKQMQQDKVVQTNEKSFKLVESQTSFTTTENHTQQDQVVIDEQIDADFQGLCYSSDTQELLDSFQNLFKILRFTTQNFYNENESISLLNLNIQIQHFKQFGNQRALGVCYNNMGVIHYNCGRFLEALQNFQKAIICAKYELEIYSQDKNEKNIEDNIKRQTVHLRNTVSQRISFQGNRDMSKQALQHLERSKAKSYFNENYQLHLEIEQLYWNLFNRSSNYYDSLFQYSQQFDNYLLDMYEDLVIENMSLSQLYLPPSLKRDFINYYALSKGKLYKNQIKEVDSIMNKLNFLYLQNFENKQSIGLKSLYQSCLLNQSNMDENDHKITKDKKQIEIKVDNMNESVILMAPVQKIRDKNQSQIISNYLKNRVEDIILQKRNTISQSRNPAQIQRQQTLNMAYDMQESVKYDDQNQKETAQNYLSQNDQLNQFQHKEKTQIKSQFNKAHQQPKNSPVFKQQNEVFTFQYSQREKNFSQTLFSPKSSNRDPLLKSKNTNKELIENSVQNITALNCNYSTKQNFSKILFKQKHNIPSFLRKNKPIFYQVRKIQKVDKLSIYNFSSDIYFQFCAIQQAQFQIKQQNYQNAAYILTNALEKCFYYLPYLKKTQLKILREIFEQNQIKSQDLQETYCKYKFLTRCNFNVCMISVCRSHSIKKRLFALSYDLINEILFKGSDSFGLIQYSFKEKIFHQIANLTGIKSVKSNLNLFEDILFQIFSNRKHSKQNQQMFSMEQQNFQLQDSQIKQNYKEQQTLSPNNKTVIQESLNASYQNSTTNFQHTFHKNQLNKDLIQHNVTPQNSKFEYQKFLFNMNNQNDGQTEEKLMNNYSQQSSLSSFDSTLQQDVAQSPHNNYNIQSQVDTPEQILQSYNMQNYIQTNKFNNSNTTEQEKLNILNSQENSFYQTQKIFQNSLNNYNMNQSISKNEGQQSPYSNQQNQKNLRIFDEVKEKNTFTPTQEQIFHQGVNSCLKQFILNTDEKLAIYVAQNKSNKNKPKQLQQNYTFLIYFTDQQLHFQNSFLLNELCLLLSNLQIELLVLVLNEQQNQQEFIDFQNYIQNGRSVITFFQSEEKLLQYIYNNREHVKNYYTPLVVEHF
ncbi:SF-assemblin/beta giardin family protein (macronuclear) [Tetrahymena thermophila SB210]|uniref:SF-assemblin/beta giardin family protein n=1 Tax=Tetrahymena thermophila (strain SB210) TaxID=312017 RepID=Q245M4_TETTS|nr:SF-assemblin/beta giardin family protein [Tetrahymena thermophila SB210]EAS03609.2 SF-assemblin/beta giardin family protein [Tetrahymena thermophila SB210]|eukprot:XP_001023854.2 SF-assemblin/beta giardin family protein [Tetrahymena thermophila SB210]